MPRPGVPGWRAPRCGLPLRFQLTPGSSKFNHGPTFAYMALMPPYCQWRCVGSTPFRSPVLSYTASEALQATTHLSPVGST